MTRFLHGLCFTIAAIAPALPAAAETPVLPGEQVLADKDSLNGKTVATECIITLADDSLGSMCGFRGNKGSIMLDARTWAPETKTTVMGECNPGTSEKLCEVTATGMLDATGVVVKLKNATVVIKQKI